MKVSVTALIDPFSIFCLPGADKCSEVIIDFNDLPKQKEDVSHGQYVAVIWKDQWVRGIVTMESQLLIWLIDYGIHIRPDNNTMFVPLPPKYKKVPSKVFEASIHGVVPVEKIVDDNCEITNTPSMKWSKGATETAKDLVKKATEVYFEPVASLETRFNNIIIGDLYLINGKGKAVNIVDELRNWPVFLNKDKEGYIENISMFYKNTRNIHRACIEKQQVDPQLPVLTINDSLEAYLEILKKIPEYETDDSSEVDDTLIMSSVLIEELLEKRKSKPFKLSAEEIQRYSEMTIDICGTQHNALQVLINKMKDLEMCESCDDQVSYGRACTRFPYDKFEYKK